MRGASMERLAPIPAPREAAPMDHHDMTAAALGRGIEAGEIDPRDLARSFLDAIEAHEHGTAIYARLTRERAEAEAEAAHARAKAGLRRGPLDGVPVSWKDLFDSAHVETAAGSNLLRGRVPKADAAVLRNAVAGGAVCLGKTHMTELAFSGLGLNPSTGTPPNKGRPGGAPGGSSSGAAASVAWGLAPMGIGSDTGGSVRVPSAWNDLVGLKTAHGRLSLEGVVPLCPSFDTVGPLCRSVEDAALALALLEGGKAADLAGATVEGTRLMVLEEALEDVEDAPRAAFQSAVDRLRAAGATVETVSVPAAEEAQALSRVLYAGEGYAVWHETIEADPDAMFHEILTRFRGGKGVTLAEHWAAWERLRELRREYGAAVAGYDAVILPTCPILPPDLGRLAEDTGYYQDRNLQTLRNTRYGNLMGGAGLTLPTGVAACGILLQGPVEEKLLRLGAAAQVALS